MDERGMDEGGMEEGGNARREEWKNEEMDGRKERIKTKNILCFFMLKRFEKFKRN